MLDEVSMVQIFFCYSQVKILEILKVNGKLKVLLYYLLMC